MYIPATEMQQYKGQWICPVCLMELIAEDTRMKKPEKYPIPPRIYGERCERCGRETEVYYIYNGRRLCKSCLDEEQAKWGLVGGGPSAAPYRVTYGKEEGLILSIVGKLLEYLGLRKRRPRQAEIVVAPRVETKVKKKGRRTNIVAFGHGRPLSEGLEEEEAENPAPRSEGLIRKTKKYPKKKKKKKRKK
jgi:hypothetical protein